MSRLERSMLRLSFDSKLPFQVNDVSVDISAVNGSGLGVYSVD